MFSLCLRPSLLLVESLLSDIITGISDSIIQIYCVMAFPILFVVQADLGSPVRLCWRCTGNSNKVIVKKNPFFMTGLTATIKDYQC